MLNHGIHYVIGSLIIFGLLFGQIGYWAILVALLPFLFFLLNLFAVILHLSFVYQDKVGMEEIELRGISEYRILEVLREELKYFFNWSDEHIDAEMKEFIRKERELAQNDREDD